MPTFTIITFYKFVRLPDCATLRDSAYDLCTQHGIKGTILLAEEGINATIAGPQAGIDAVLAWLAADERFAELVVKTSYTDEMPFYRAKVRVKPEIVTFGQPNIDPSKQTGTYVEPDNWNDVISDPDVVLIDTRNDFEVQIGSFKGAVNPKTTTFGQFADYVREQLDPTENKKVAMFCTGGIRCEKASAFMLQQGFEEVYHLKGGILQYLEDVSAESSLWQGECFVFDQRVTVDHDLQPGKYELCYGCWQPINSADKQLPSYEEGVTCFRCHDVITDERLASLRERQLQIKLAAERGERHLGRDPITPKG